MCVTGMHGVMESWRDANLWHIYNTAGLVTPDGMPLVWLSRLMGTPFNIGIAGRAARTSPIDRCFCL